MLSNLPLFPHEALHRWPDQVDALYFFLLGVSAFFAVLIAALIVFAIKYRRRSPDADRPRRSTARSGSSSPGR